MLDLRTKDKVILDGTDYDVVNLDGVEIFRKGFSINKEKAKLSDKQFIVELEPSKLVLDNIPNTPKWEKSGADYYYPYKFTTQSSKYSWYADVDPETYLKQAFYTNGNITASGSIRGLITGARNRTSIYVWDKTTKRGDLKIGSNVIQKMTMEYYNFNDKGWISLGTFDIYGSYAGRVNYNYKEDITPTSKQLEIRTGAGNYSPKLFLRFTKIS